MKKILASSIALTVLMSGTQVVLQEQTTQAATSKVTYKTITKKTVTKYATKKVKTNDLLVGETKVKVKGKNGYKLKVYKQTLKNGKVIKTTYVKTKKTVKPVTKVILVGTKEVTKPQITKPAGYIDQPSTPKTPVEKNELLIIKQPVDYDTQYIDDPTLPLGERIVEREGKKGVREKAYNQRIIDGKEVSTTPAYVRLITPPVNAIVRMGTKIDPTTADTDIKPIPASEMNTALGFNTKFKDGRYMSDTIALHQGYRVGQKTWDGYTVTKVNIGIDSTFDEMKKLSAEERYAKSKNTENTIYAKKGTEERFMGMKANFKTQKMFNELKLFDINVLNQEFLKLVNAERASLGIAPLKIDERLKQGNEQRAQEMANYGTVAINGKAHSRPDGSGASTAFDYLGKGVFSAENSWGGMFGGNFYKLTSEKALAEAVYIGWKGSHDGHHEVMINPDYKSVYFSMKIGEEQTFDSKYSGRYNALIGNAVFISK